MSEFVTTKTIKVINEVTDGHLSNHALISIVPYTTSVSVVVGAMRKDNCASCFSKKSLRELIGVLQEVYDAMEDKGKE